MKGNLTSAVTRKDAQRLINAAMPTLSDRFPTITKDRRKVHILRQKGGQHDNEKRGNKTSNLICVCDGCSFG
jgi:hypothetical protein